MYDLFLDIAGVPEDVFASSELLQEVFAACTFGLVAFSFVLFAYMLIVIFRGWK